MIALVRGVIAASTRAGSMVKLIGSMSTNTGTRPFWKIGLTVVGKPAATVMTSSPGPMPAADKTTLDDYMENIREIERRVERAAQNTSDPTLVLPEAPAGIPYSYEEHVDLMFDLLAIAYQANITRVATFMMAREVSNRTYTQVGVNEGHHAVSHHQNKPEKLDMLARIQAFHVGLFGEFLAKLDSVKEGDGSLLDHSVLLYGSNMSNSNLHDHYPLPNVVVGGGYGKLKGKTFRISNMGDETDATIAALLKSLDAALAETPKAA